MEHSTHIPVLRDEAIMGLNIQANGIYLDGTFGRGGHARIILSKLGAKGRLLLMDKDPDAIACAQALFAADTRVCVTQGSFATLSQWSETAAGIDGVLLDLGVSSPQLDCADRGFSFSTDGPLDMRMDRGRGENAAHWIAKTSEQEIADTLFRYGEEKKSRQIAQKIVAHRAEKPIQTTRELAELVEKTIGWREKGKHPATRTFQALRIVINRELEDLQLGLEASVTKLNVGGRLVVISFHSLEDRIVKHFIRDESRGVTPTRRGLPPQQEKKMRLRPIGRAQQPSAAEMATNPRSRSAVLRVTEKIA